MSSYKERFVEGSMAILALLSVALICIEYLVELSAAQLVMVYVTDLVICLVFAADFAFRMYKADNKRSFLKNHGYEILAMIPAYAFILLQTQTIFGALVRSLRLIRVIRLVFVLARLRRTLRTYSRILQRSYLIYLLSVCLATVFIGGLGAYIVENDAPNALIRTIGDALWWSLSTVTTVGYGDIVPSTFVGRVIGVITMFVGIALVGVFISALGATLTERRLGKSVSRATLEESMIQTLQKRLQQPEQLSQQELELLQALIGHLHKRAPLSKSD